MAGAAPPRSKSYTPCKSNAQVWAQVTADQDLLVLAEKYLLMSAETKDIQLKQQRYNIGLSCTNKVL